MIKVLLTTIVLTYFVQLQGQGHGMVLSVADPCSVDVICRNLSTSQDDYKAAADGDLIIITDAERQTLMDSLTDLTTVGQWPAGAVSFGANQTMNTHSTAIPSGAYVLLFRADANGSNTTDSKIKTSTTSSLTGYSDADNIPSYSGDIFAVYKRPSSLSSATWYSIYSGAARNIRGKIGVSGSSYRFGSGDVNSLTNFSNAERSFQIVYTNTKQW